MVWDYIEFLNEAKVDELKVGFKVLFLGKTSDFATTATLNLKGLTGTIKKIDKSYYSTFTIELDEPFKLTRDTSRYYYKSKETIKEIKINSYQVRYVKIIDDEQYKEQKRKIESNEIVKFKATKAFNTIIKYIKFKKSEDYYNMTNFDIDKDNTDVITFIPSKKITESDPEKYRQSSKAGRILKRLNPDLTDKQVEDFQNKFRAEVEAYLKEPEVNVFTGKDISHWYDEKRYQYGGGSLNNSCMRYDSAQYRVKFYDEYPDKIALATIIKGDKLHARALIWRLDDGRVYMDRIYSINDQARHILLKYAEKHGMSSYNNKKGGRGTITLKNGAEWKTSRPYFDSVYVNKINGKDLELGVTA
jgi:hypothetical protein